MPAPSYCWLTCDEDGAYYLWRVRPALADGHWDALPVGKYVVCKPASPMRLEHLRAQGVAIPEPGGITELEAS